MSKMKKYFFPVMLVLCLLCILWGSWGTAEDSVKDVAVNEELSIKSSNK
ncbi:MAG: hypothetical protein H6Q74_1574 [Firmicutes bacterium]|nr:hypothetical protein [Bacillota bacterium]